MVRRTIYIRELRFCFQQAEIADDICTKIVSSLFQEVWSPDRGQYILHSGIRSVKEVIDVLEKSNLVREQIEIISGIFAPCDEDLEPPASLLRLLNKGDRVAVFTGAGASQIIGIPGWKELATRAVEFLFDKKGYSHSECKYLRNEFLDPKQLLTVFHSIIDLGSNEAENFYRKALSIKSPNDDDPRKYNIYPALARFNCVKVTTNLEDEFGIAVDKLRTKTVSIDEQKELAEQVSTKVPRFCVPSGTVTNLRNLTVDAIYHLHGRLDTLEKAVMTTKRYVKSYYNSKEKPDDDEPPYVYDFLQALFRDYSVLFVGTSLSEFVILERILGGKNKDNKNKHFALLPCFSNELGEFSSHKQYLGDFGITPVPYFLDLSAHSRLHPVLENWAARIEMSRSQSFLNNLEFLRGVAQNG